MKRNKIQQRNYPTINFNIIHFIFYIFTHTIKSYSISYRGGHI